MSEESLLGLNSQSNGVEMLFSFYSNECVVRIMTFASGAYVRAYVCFCVKPLTVHPVISCYMKS